MPFFFHFFERCKCCIDTEKEEKEEKKVDIAASWCAHIKDSNSLTLEQMKKLNHQNPLLMLQEYVIPGIMDRLDDHILQKSTVTLNKKLEFIEMDEHFASMCCVCPKKLENAVNSACWVVNIHQEDFSSVMIDWLSFQKSIRSGDVNCTFFQKFRVIDKNENKTKHVFSYAVVETYSETFQFRRAKLFCYQLDDRGYDELVL